VGARLGMPGAQTLSSGAYRRTIVLKAVGASVYTAAVVWCELIDDAIKYELLCTARRVPGLVTSPLSLSSSFVYATVIECVLAELQWRF